MTDTYLSWMIKNTKTSWWHDSGEAAELERGLERGCVGVTTNPFLANVAVVPEVFAYRIPDTFADEQAAPLLCAGSSRGQTS